MRYKLVIIVLILFYQNGFAQKPKKEYILRWNVKDTITYNVAFGEINVKINDSITDINDPFVQIIIEKIRKEIGIDLKNYKVTSNIYPKDSNFNVRFFFNNIPVLNGMINKKGVLLTSVEKKSENFFKIFFELPTQSIKVGDEWKSNLQIQKNFRGITLTDSTRIDRFIFDKIIKENGDDIALLKLELSEKYYGKYKNENGKDEDAVVQIFYNSEGYFNITKGKWNSIDGIVVFEADIKQKKKSIFKVGLIEK